MGFRKYKQTKRFDAVERLRVGLLGGNLREGWISAAEKNLPVFLAICLPISIIVSLQRLA